jgi:hypothetical protein
MIIYRSLPSSRYQILIHRMRGSSKLLATFLPAIFYAQELPFTWGWSVDGGI